jgi:hypothetical protein
LPGCALFNAALIDAKMSTGSSQYPSDMAIGDGGTAYIVGRVNGRFKDTESIGKDDCFLTIVDPEGQSRTIQFGTENNDRATSVICHNKDIFVAGSRESSRFATSPFISILSESGEQKTELIIDSKNEAHIFDMFLFDGFLYVGGMFEGEICSIGSAGKYDVFIAKYDLSLNRIWIKTIGYSGFESLKEPSEFIFVDASGLYATFYTDSKKFPGRIDASLDVVLVKLTHDGEEVFCDAFGYAGDQVSSSIVADDDFVYIAGAATDPFKGVPFLGSYGKSIFGFILKTTKDGEPVEVVYEDSYRNRFLEFTDVEIIDGDVFVTGYTSDDYRGIRNKAFQTDPSFGWWDIVFGRYSKGFEFVYGKTLGTPYTDYGFRVKGDMEGNAYVVGYAMDNIDKDKYEGKHDIAFFKIDSKGEILYAKLIN